MMAFLLGGRSGEHYGNWSDAQTTATMPPRSPRHHDTEGDMDCQDAQQQGLQGAGWTGRSASHGTPGVGGYERDLEGHPPEKRSASDPRTRQGKPPGR